MAPLSSSWTFVHLDMLLTVFLLAIIGGTLNACLADSTIQMTVIEYLIGRLPFASVSSLPLFPASTPFSSSSSSVAAAKSATLGVC